MLDVILQARDRGLFRAITDCGAGGFSSAVGEMGAELGAEVDLERAPLKYEGLSYTEIWISEAQERMVLAVPPEHWPALQRPLRSRARRGDRPRASSSPPGRLTLRYHGEVVADLSMEFLHEGRPAGRPRRRRSRRRPSGRSSCPIAATSRPTCSRSSRHWDVCSKEWIVRQYDHEVQGRTVIKPLVGVARRRPGRRRGRSCRSAARRAAWRSPAASTRATAGSTPTPWPACVIDEAIRNCVAVGADPERIALLDNFCWGNTERPETLGSLVLAAQACHDLALAYGTPFISGKDSLNNEYTHEGQEPGDPADAPDQRDRPGARRPPCVTMDLKEPGNLLSCSSA